MKHLVPILAVAAVWVLLALPRRPEASAQPTGGTEPTGAVRTCSGGPEGLVTVSLDAITDEGPRDIAIDVRVAPSAGTGAGLVGNYALEVVDQTGAAVRPVLRGAAARIGNGRTDRVHIALPLESGRFLVRVTAAALDDGDQTQTVVREVYLESDGTAVRSLTPAEWYGDTRIASDQE